MPLTVCVQEHRMYLTATPNNDAYYVVTPTACSCPEGQTGKRCEHILRFFATDEEREEMARARHAKLAALQDQTRKDTIDRMAEIVREKVVV